MKKNEIAKSKNWLSCKVKLKNSNKEIGAKLKRITIVLVFIAFVLPLNSQVKADEKIKPGKKQATLILSNGKKIVLNTSNDTIVNSETKGVRIKIDSFGINYITTDSIVKLNLPKSKSVKKK